MGTLKIGADHFPPYQYIDDNGNSTGSDLNFIKDVISEMGHKPVFILENWANIENQFNEKKLDVLFQVQRTKEREKTYHFSKKFRDAKTILITSNSHLLKTVTKDLFNTKYYIGVIKNFKYGEFIDNIDEENKKYYNSTEDIINATICSEVDFGVVDDGVFNYLTKNIQDELFTLPDLSFNRPLYVIFHDSELRDHFNQYL